MGKTPKDQYSEAESARRRDEVIRRMANTPPQPRVKVPTRPQENGKQAAEDRVKRRPGAGDKGA